MKYNVSDHKLKIIIDELGEEYKDLLIERVLDDTHETDADSINPSDLIKLDVATKSKLRADKKMQRQNRLYSMISLLGIMYALLGLIIMLLNQFEETVHYDSLTMISFILIFMGLFVAMFSLLFRNMSTIRHQYYRGQNRTITSYEIINKWKEIEALVHELTPDSDTLSLSSMVKNLEDTKIISKQDVEAINKLLKIRNKIVHGSDNISDFSQTELRTNLIQTNKIIAKMKKLV